MMQPWCRADGEYCSQAPQACGKNLDYTFQKGMAGRDVLVLNKYVDQISFATASHFANIGS